MTTRRETILRIADRLAPLYGAREARSVALLAVVELSGLPRCALLSDLSAPLEIEALDDAVEQLAVGRPVQYVAGRTEFCGLDLAVREGVLIPRPETEELVGAVAEAHPAAGRILDVGTGSGCIALALKKRLPRAELLAADISEAALAVAAENSRRTGLHVTLRRADALHGLADVFPERFDVIVSNPPYVPQGDREAMHINVKEFEPGLALFVPDDDPLLFYRAIARAAREMLVPGGALWFEIYEHAAEALRTLLAAEGFERIGLKKDMYDKPRILCSRLG